MKYKNTSGGTVDTSFSWNGKTGDEVLKIISGALDNTVTDFLIETDASKIDASKGVPYWILKGGNEKDENNPTGYISLIEPAEYEFVTEIGTRSGDTFTEYLLPSFLPAGYNLSIPYTFVCKKTGGTELVSNVLAKIQVLINNKVVAVLSQTTISGFINGYKTGTVEIGESYLLEGCNTIQINFINTDLGLSHKAISSTEIYYIKEVSIDCSVLCGDGDYSTPISNDSSLIFLDFSFNLASGTKLPDYLSKEGAFKLKIKLNSCTELVLTELSNKTLSLINLLQSTSYTPGNQDVKIWVEIKNELGNQLRSPYVFYRFFGTGESYANSLYATFKAYFEEIEPTKETSAIQYKVTTYKATLINVTQSTQTYTFGFANDSLAEDTILGYSSNGYNSKDLTITKTFESEGTETLTLSEVSTNASGEKESMAIFSYGVKVEKGSSVFAFPTGNLLLNLNGSGKVGGLKNESWTYGNYTTEFSGFDWSGNGWKDGSLVLNQGATAIVKCPVLSSNTYTISFNIETDGVNEEELISCTNSAKDFGFIIYTDKILWMHYQGGKLLYTYGSGAHEITLVKYSSIYNNTCILYIDGSIQKIESTTVQNKLETSITLTANNDSLKVNNIVAYSRSLSFAEVLALYGYHQSDSESYFDKNNIFGTNDVTSIGYHGSDLKPDTLPIGSRYMIIEGTSKKATDGTIKYSNPWEIINGYDGTTAATREKNKGIRHPVNSIKYIVKTESGQDSHNFYVVGGTLSAQGTSSMAYPIKNFRIYFKKKIDKSLKDYYNTSSIFDPGKDDKKGDAGYSVAAYYGVTEDFKTTTPSIIGKTDTSTATIDDFKVEISTGNYSGDSVAVSEKTDSDGNKTLKAAKVVVSMYQKGDGFGTEEYTYASAPAKLFCLKADFAESSGCHNTGFARFADYYLNKELSDVRDSSSDYDCFRNDGKGLGLPFETCRGTYKYDIRSTVDGMPIYLFFKQAGQDDSEAVYAGKYNMNNDKSSEDVFGFTGITDYYNNETVKTESSTLASLFSDTNGDFENTHYKYKIKDGEYDGCDDGTSAADGASIFVNPNECWEFSNNTVVLESTPTDSSGKTHEERVNIGAFNYPYKDSNYPGLSPFTVKSGSSDGASGGYAWLEQAWEYRFPDLGDWVYKKETIDGAEVEYKAGDLHTSGQVVPQLLSSLYEFIYKHNINFASDKNSTANEFAYYLSYYFHVNYLVKYYLLTKFFGCVDLRIKNAMLSFLCVPDAKNHEGDTSKNLPPMGHMRAYYIFYDNDTILGLDNLGALTWPWNMDDGSNSTIPYGGTEASSPYAGAEGAGLWDTMEYCLNLYKKGSSSVTYAYRLGRCIAKAYEQLSSLLPAVSSTQTSQFDNYFESICDYFSDSAYNLDAQVKYIYPEKLNSSKEAFASNSYEKEQGNRKPHRKGWIAKRKAWYDNMYQVGDSANYKISFKPDGVFSLYKKSPILVTQALPKFKSGLATGSGSVYSSLSTKAGETQSLEIDGSSVSEFINVVGLYAALKVDFSLFYTTSTFSWDETKMESGLPLQYLTALVFTPDLNTRSGEYSYISSLAITSIINSKIVPNLQSLDFGYIMPPTGSSFSEMDLSDLTRLKTVNTRNTSINTIVLPKGESLETLVVYKPVNIGDTETEVENNGIVGKQKLTSIEIQDWTNLKKLVIGNGNNEAVYNYILLVLGSWTPKTPEGELIPQVIINFSQDSMSPTKISDSALDSLVTISKAKSLNTLTYNISISGYIYNDSDSASDYLGTLKNAFSGLYLTNTQGKITLKTGGVTTIKEGESVTFVANDSLPRDNWGITIDGVDYNSATKTGVAKYLEIVYDGEENASQVTITAKDSEDLSFGASSVIKVTVKSTSYNAESPNPDLIAEASVDVSYVAVTKVSIKTKFGKDAIIGSSGVCGIYTDESKAKLNSDIVISVNSTCTKKITTSDILLYIDDKAFSIAGDSYGIQYSDINDESKFCVVINNIKSNTMLLYKDITLKIPGTSTDMTFSYAKDLSKYFWMYKIKADSSVNNDEIDTITRKYLNESFTLNSNTLANCCSLEVNSLKTISDFLFLKYYDWSGTFEIPANKQWYGELAIPDKVTLVSWTQSSFETDYDYNENTITFPKQMTDCTLSLSGMSNQITGITLDFEKCANITTLCGLTHPDIVNNYIAIGFTYLSSSESNTYTYSTINKNIKLPSSITQVGYYDYNSSKITTIGSDSSISWNTKYAMFNIDGHYPGDESANEIPMFSIPATSSCNKFGFVYGYNVSVSSTSEAQDMALLQFVTENSKNIWYMSHTCVNGAGLYKDNVSIDLTKLKVLGAFSFYMAPSMTVTLNSEVETLGCFAFGKSSVFVKSTTASKIDKTEIVPNDETVQSVTIPTQEFLKFTKVGSIGQMAFLSFLLGAEYFEFSSSKISIEQYAFSAGEKGSFHVYLSAEEIENSNDITIDVNAFGSKLKNSYLYVTEAVYNALKTLSNFDDLCNNVNLYKVS